MNANNPFTGAACVVKTLLMVCSLFGLAVRSEAVIVCDSDPVPATLTASPSILYVPGTNTASLVVRLTSAVATDTLLGLRYSGTASNGVDVQTLPSAAIFPAGWTAGALTVTPSATHPAQIRTLTVT